MYVGSSFSLCVCLGPNKVTILSEKQSSLSLDLVILSFTKTHGKCFVLFLSFFFPQVTVLKLTFFQVCEVYKLHRETFYLAQDFFDRYMATQQNIVKTLLQLIGISSLFIAAKLEVNHFQMLCSIYCFLRSSEITGRGQLFFYIFLI